MSSWQGLPSWRSASFAASPHWLDDLAHEQAPSRKCVDGTGEFHHPVLYLAIILLLRINVVDGATSPVSDKQCLVEPDCSSEELYVWCHRNAEGTSPKSGCICRSGIPRACLPCDSDISLHEHCSNWCQGYKPCRPSTVEHIAITITSYGHVQLTLAIVIPILFLTGFAVAVVARWHCLATSDESRNGVLRQLLRHFTRRKYNASIDHPCSAQEQGPPCQSSASLFSIPQHSEPDVACDTDSADDQLLA